MSQKKNSYIKDSFDRFGYEWKRYNIIFPQHEIQFLKWIYPLKKEDFKGKTVLDAGCGIGRNGYWALRYGAKKVVAFDYDKRIVKEAVRNLCVFKNASVCYNSIYDIEFENEFDIVMGIGIIHHLEKPNLAIEKLYKAVKKNGLLLIWVYGYEGNELYFKFNWLIRKVTSRIPINTTHFLAYFFTAPIYVYVKLIKQGKPYLKQLSTFNFNHIQSIIFDQLLPRVAHYWKKEEAYNLLKNVGAKDIKIFRCNENSWTVIGRKG